MGKFLKFLEMGCLLSVNTRYTRKNALVVTDLQTS